MYCVRKVDDDLYWVGGNDHRLTLFENIHPLPRGISYNSYLLLDEKTVLFDTVDWAVCRQFLENVSSVLNGRDLDYLVIDHVEPDHGSSIEEIIIRYPEIKIICTQRAVIIMNQFGFNTEDKCEVVKEGDSKNFGNHTVTFIEAPMVHWPEVMATFDITNGALFSADAFGTFGALDGRLFNDELNFEKDWLDEMRRYYTNIVGKYGPFVQTLINKTTTKDIKMICPLHGPVWRTSIDYLIDKHNKWSKYEPEENGVLIAYASMYGNTEFAAQILAAKIVEKGCSNIRVYDVSNTSVSQLISESFKYSHIVLASVTYNTGVFPVLQNYLEDMKALGLMNRKIAIIENGSWGPRAGSHISNFINELKNMTIIADKVTVKSSVSFENTEELDLLAEKIIESL